MVRVLRIPGLVDLVRCDEPADIQAVVAEPRFDRRFAPAGPLLNRIIAGRIRRILVLDGKPLPPVAPRLDAERMASQASLTSALAARGNDAPCDPQTLDRLAETLNGEAARTELGCVAQTAVGRLFVAEFSGTPETWRAALTLDAAVRSFNPLRRLRWMLTGEVKAARAVLATAMQSDAAGVHAIGIAVHNLVESFARMAILARSRDALALIPADVAASRCLAAPSRVLRQAGSAGMTAQGDFRPGTLVMLDLEAARARTLRSDIAFLTAGWSACPAHAWVPALLAAVWRHAASRSAPGART